VFSRLWTGVGQGRRDDATMPKARELSDDDLVALLNKWLSADLAAE